MLPSFSDLFSERQENAEGITQDQQQTISTTRENNTRTSSSSTCFAPRYRDDVDVQLLVKQHPSFLGNHCEYHHHGMNSSKLLGNNKEGIEHQHTPYYHNMPSIATSTNNNNNTFDHTDSSKLTSPTHVAASYNGNHGSTAMYAQSPITHQQHAKYSGEIPVGDTCSHGHDVYNTQNQPFLPGLDSIYQNRQNNTPNITSTTNSSHSSLNYFSPTSNLNTSQQLYFSNPSSIRDYSKSNVIRLVSSGNNTQILNNKSLNAPNGDIHLNAKTQPPNACIAPSSTPSYPQHFGVGFYPPTTASTRSYPQHEYFQHEQKSSTNSVNELPPTSNHLIISNSTPNVQNLKRKCEDACDVDTKKRKQENESNYGQIVIESCKVSEALGTPNVVTAQVQQNSSNILKKTKKGRSQKSPTTESENSLNSSSNNFSTSNSLSGTPQSAIQFMNFSISEKSKIKFVNARHQQIGINDGAWTEKEHADFMRGLDECGKGRWREIAEHYVLTRTRTQVASHARKYLDLPPYSNKK